MDEEENDQNIVKDVKKVVDETQKGIKKTKKIIKFFKIFGPFLLCLLLIFIIVVVVTWAIFQLISIFKINGDLDENKNSISSIISLSEDGKNYEINYDYIYEAIENMEKEGLSLDDLELSDEKIESELEDIEDLDDVSEGESGEKIRKGLIKKYVDVHLTTLYPKIGSKKVDGGIVIQRDNINLNYIPYEELKAKVDENNSSCKEYFSINMTDPNEPLLCYAIVNEVNGEYEAILKEERYQYLVEPYSMPFDFLIMLHMFSQNTNFMRKVVKLVNNNEIIISIKDTVYENETDVSYSGTWYKAVVTEETVSGSDTATTNVTLTDGVINNSNIGNYYSKEAYTKIDKTMISEKVLKSANTWIAITENEYEKKVGEKEKTGEITENINIPAGETENVFNGKYYNAISENTYSRAEIEETTTTYSTVTQYVEKNKSTKFNLEKDEQDIKNEKSAGFIDLIKEYNDVRSNLISVDEWFLELLSEDENTQDLEQIMRYVFYKLTNDESYGVTDLDSLISMFDTSEFSEMTSGIYGDTVEDKVWYTMRSYGFSEYAVAGLMGNIKAESNFETGKIEDGNNNEGNGLCQWSYGRKTQLKSYAASKGVDWTDANTQIEFLITEIMGTGPAQGYADKQWNNSDYESWKNSKSATEAAEIFCNKFERPGISHMDNRKRYAEEYYQKYKGKTLSGQFISDGSDNVIGTFTSGITGKTFCIYKQNTSSNCNIASSMCVASGYASDKSFKSMYAIANPYGTLIPAYSSEFYNKFGLKFQRTVNSGDYRSKIRSQLQSGGYAIIYITQSSYYGKSNQKWTSKAHWLAILGYRQSEGTEEIFVGDSGHSGTGWYSIDEFMKNGGSEVSTIVLVNEK